MFLEEVLYLHVSFCEELNRTILESGGGSKPARSVEERRACLKVTHFGIDKRHEHILSETVIARFRSLDGFGGVNLAIVCRAVGEIAEEPVKAVLIELIGESLCGTAFDSDGFTTVLVEGEEHRHALSASHHSSHFLVGFYVVVNFVCHGFCIDCIIHFTL